MTGSTGALQWSSDNPAVATVERLGSTAAAGVKGVAPDTATIRAVVGNVSDTATITVRSLAFDRLASNGGRHACLHLRAHGRRHDLLLG